MEGVLLRLSEKERETLQLLNAALRVSEYTDDVDDFRRFRREDKMTPSLKEFFSAVIGLTVAASELPATTKQALVGTNPTFKDVQQVLASAFEVARRHKRLNPHHNRSEFGKLVMILQDANAPKMLQDLGMETVVAPVKTVGAALSRLKATGLLEEPSLEVVLRPLPANPSAQMVQDKQQTIKDLLDKYAPTESNTESAEPSSPSSSPSNANSRRELVERCILSIADHIHFVDSCVSPIKKLVSWLELYFVKDKAQSPSIEIRSGRNGSCLSHNHDTQVQYVKESLTLWHIIQRDIFDFWQTVEEDMILDCRGSYRFCDTGQGYHRMLAAPKTFGRMNSALSEAHQAMGGWVGIKVVHLGDRDVPNALVFIDKYTIIPKMLTPIVQTIERLDEIFDEEKQELHPGVRNLLLSKYGSGDSLKRKILADFFKHAFDGSGDDGGNCIDGRLTSAWNWCHLLHKKDYYDAFVLTGFTGFDG